jgi:hypothetical protein
LDLEQIRKLKFEADKYLAELEASLQSKSATEKETAVQSAEEIRQFLETKANQFTAVLENDLSNEEKSILSEIN